MNNANEMIFPGNLKVFAQTVEQEVYGQLYRLLSLDASTHHT